MTEQDYKKLAEKLYIKRMITEVHPTGIVSLVSDTFDLWSVLDYALPELKDEILAREQNDGNPHKVVIRPDSGDPVKILCGDSESSDPRVRKGVVELLWDTFGGTVNAQGYKVLNPAIGAIYGDSITIQRATDIFEGLKAKGFASLNVVLGIGSYTYQMITRDSLGFAMKATSVTVNGEERAIFKDPITDDGTKKSAKGRVQVKDLGDKNQGSLLIVEDETSTLFHNSPNLLKTIYLNGTFVKETSLDGIREKLNG